MESDAPTAAALYKCPDDFYGQLSLPSLLARVVHDSDVRALNEFHNHRRPFHLEDQERLPLTRFVSQSLESSWAFQAAGRNQGVIERAYDLTIDKFFNLPQDSAKYKPDKHCGPDCRYYFDAYLKHVRQYLQKNRQRTAWQREDDTAHLLQNQVERHLYFSLLEARRQEQRLERRYRWKVNGFYLTLRMPVEIPGRLCSRWLTLHFPDVDPRRSGEQDRIQRQVDQLLVRRRILSLSQMDPEAGEGITSTVTSLSALVSDELTVCGLAQMLAEEKSENFELQRPAIRHLGVWRLRQLIKEIIERVVRGDYVAAELAAKYNLSPATLSRFAGSQWRKEPPDNRYSIPDLWRNAAQMLANHPECLEAAHVATIWQDSKTTHCPAEMSPMTDGLYFLPILMMALQHGDDVAGAMQKAQLAIQHLGRQDRFQDGFSQFNALMAEISDHHNLWLEASLAERLYDLAANTVEEKTTASPELLKLMRQFTDCETLYHLLCQVMRHKPASPDLPVVNVVRDGDLLGERMSRPVSGQITIKDIHPGQYRIELDTGRIVWQGDLLDQDLLWQKAYPHAPLEMAAESQESDLTPTIERVLLDGELIIRIYPGVESGWLEIEFVEEINP